MKYQTNASAPDEHFMQVALREAKKAFRAGEVPVGAVIVKQGQIIGRGYNKVEARQDASQHAELIAMRQAAKNLKSWRLIGCYLYVTLEPCAMCAGAAVWFRINTIIYGTPDPKAGACGSVLAVAGEPRLNHRPQIAANICATECRSLLKKFFQELRQRN